MSFCSIETFASLAFVSCHLDCISAASLLKSIRPQTCLYSFCVYWRTSHSFTELNSLLCLPFLGSHTQYCFPTLFSKVTISKELLLPPNLLQVLLYLTFFNWKTKVTELCIKYRWLGQVYLGGVMVGKYRIMERSQEAIITQEDLIVTLVGGGRRDGTRSSDSQYIYLQQSLFHLLIDLMWKRKSCIKDD